MQKLSGRVSRSYLKVSVNDTETWMKIEVNGD